MPLYPGPTSAGGYLPSDAGYAGWSFDPAEIQGGAIWPTAGLLNLVRVKVPAATINTVTIHFTVAGGTLTAGQCFASVYSGTGTLLSSTADQSTNWASGGLKAMALTAPAAVTGPYAYVAFFANGTTMPTMSRALNSSGAITNPGLTAPNLRYAAADTGLTTAAPASFGAQTAAATAWWVALS